MKDKLFKPPETESYLGFIAPQTSHLPASADACSFIYAFMRDSVFFLARTLISRKAQNQFLSFLFLLILLRESVHAYDW